MDHTEFKALCLEGYDRIPVQRELSPGLEAALALHQSYSQAPYTYLLESLKHGGEQGHFSIIGLPCRTVVRIRGRDVIVEHDGVVIEQIVHDDPLGWVEDFRARYKVAEVPGLPPFSGGLVGYFGYGTARYVEPTLGRADQTDALNVPDIALFVSEELLVFDHTRGKLCAIVHAQPSEDHAWGRVQARLDALERELLAAQSDDVAAETYQATADKTHFGADRDAPECFKAAVQHIKEYIYSGDVMQVVLSQRFSAPLRAQPIELYRVLRTTNPSPYMFYINYGDFQLVGCSPEILVQLSEGIVTVRPIAGTRPRGADAAEDQRLECELLADPKERAEHLMLIDLGRNDVGRVCSVGSVRLTQKMIVERYSHVMHIVSKVSGELARAMTPMDALRATFPAGTVTGAPKIRAMEVIEELEPLTRGVYAGAVGYISWAGTVDTAIAIRTSIIKGGVLHVQAGAGIVADSIAEREWEEILNKAGAIFRAKAIAETRFALNASS